MIGTAGKSWLSRRGAWGLAILVTAVLTMGAVAALPHVWYAVNDARLAESRIDLRFIEAKMKAANGTRPTGLTASDNIEPLFVGGATSGMALAGLQRLIGKLAEENGMVVERTQPLQTEHSNGLAVLRMEVEAAGSIENLRGYLLAIEAGQPLIFVNQAKISAPVSADESGTVLPSDKLAVALQLETYGWWETEP
jgi:hypothetical protein